jgi:hypothetical protein
MLIGLCGKPRSGKSEVSFILQQRYDFNSISTKRPLALACHELTGIPHAQFLTHEGKESEYKGVSLRKIMGEVQNVLESMFGDYHTIAVALEHQYYPERGNYVLDSLRKTQPVSFPGYVVEVKSVRSVDTGNAFDEYDTSHIDYTIYNNGNLDSLDRDIRLMISYLERHSK